MKNHPWIAYPISHQATGTKSGKWISLQVCGVASAGQ